MPWTRTTGRGWAAEGLHVKSFQPELGAAAACALAAVGTVTAAAASRNAASGLITRFQCSIV